MNIEKNLEKNRENFYRAISLLQDENDIYSALPSPEYQTFFPLMEGIISTLEEEYRDYQSLGDDSEVSEVLESIERKISICKSKVEEIKKQSFDDSVDNLARYPKRHLIYAKTAFNGTCLERDLKDIPSEYYGSILSTLDTLEHGEEIGGNIEKVKRLTQNKELFGLYEIKEFKIRLIYRIISENLVYVMQVRMKKDDNSVRDRRELAIRKKNTENEYMVLKKETLDPIKRETLIMEHDDINRGIRELLDSSKRRGNSGKNGK